MFIRNLLISTALGLSVTGPSIAETPIQIAELSGRLFELALEEEDSVMMITAAKLRKTLVLEKSDFAPVGADKMGDQEDEIVSWENMLTLALELAPDDDQIAGLVDDVSSESTKGVATGQVYSISTIRSGGTDTYPALPYTGGDYAEVYIEGQGRPDLNVFVKDSKGRLVCSDTDISAIAYCGWRPATGDNFVIEVQNKGNNQTKYSLITN